MKRMWSVMLSVLLGALMVGLGTGYFLHLANKDRQALAAEADHAKNEAQNVKEQSQKAIQEANNKLQLASQEIDKAHETLQALEQERSLIAKAEPLLPPDPKLIKDWKTVISSTFGISVSYPSNAYILQNSDTDLALGAIPLDGIIKTLPTSSSAWLDIQPYTLKQENILLSRVTSTKPVSFFINGRLLTGVTGQTPSSNEPSAFILRLYNNGTSTHIIWLQSLSPLKNLNIKKTDSLTPKEILATFDFKD